MTASPATQPLAGLRVISLAEQFPGPLATLLLADLGADVILVERPGSGDPSRRYDGHFSALNRNKRSIVLDLKSEAGRAAFLKLVGTADVLVEGFRPGTMARLGFGPEVFAQQFPDLVYASISSFGQSGPLKNVAGHDISIQGVAGMLDIPPGKEAETELPVLPIADIASGMAAAFGIVAMLLGRARGQGVAPVDVSMLDCLAFWMAPLSLPRVNGMTYAPFPPNEPAYGVFATADGRQLTLSIAGEDHLWRALCAILGLEGVDHLNEAARVAARATLQLLIRKAIAARQYDELNTLFEQHAVAFGPMQSMTEAALDPRIAARGLFLDLDHKGRKERHVRQPMLFGGEAVAPTRSWPELGEHTPEILDELGLASPM